MFTGGKWEHDARTGAIKSGSCTVCNVHGATVYNMESSAGECEGNARLIANAPEMYRILTVIHEWCRDYDLDSDIECDISEVLKSIDGEEWDDE